MVQGVLNRRNILINIKLWMGLVIVLCLGAPIQAKHLKKDKTQPPPPDLIMDGGRRLSFERTFSSEREVLGSRSFWTRLLDVVAGEPERHFMVRPYGVAVDSRGRVIVTDPGQRGIHIFDFDQHKYKFISRASKEDKSMLSPQCIALDADDNIYVTDSESGRIFVFDPTGKYKRMIGGLRGGEGFFKRPTGIAVDSLQQRIYVSDTLRNKVFIIDMQGAVLQTIGTTGTEPGEFNFPTELSLNGSDLAVVDAMNFRVQVFDRSGKPSYVVGTAGDSIGSLFRPKGIGFDSEGHLYVADAALNNVQVFDRKSELLYYFGMSGADLGEFALPAGLSITRSDRIYVVDSSNRRVQVFSYHRKQPEDAK